MGSICSEDRVKLTPEEKAIVDCKLCRDKINAYIRRLEVREKKSREKAKELLKNKQRDRAKFYLRQAKLHSAQIKTNEGQLEMVNNQIIQIESSKNLQECLKVLQNGKDVLKKMQDSIKIEEWEKIRDDMDELKEKDKEISDFLKDYGINEVEYDDEVNNDLDKLMEEVGVSKAKEDIKLPEVPKEEITEDKNKKEEKDNTKKKLVVA